MSYQSDVAYRWDTPIRYVKGLGPVRAKEMTKIKINTVGDLLEYPPLHYVYPGSVSIADAKEGHVVIKAKIEDMGLDYDQTVEATLRDETGTCQAVWYNSPWLLINLHPGMTVMFWGKFKGGVLQQPKWTTVESSMENVYGGQYGIHHATIRTALKEVLSNVKLPSLVLGAGRKYTFEAFHFPENKAEQQMALKVLKFDECLMLQLALAERRKGREQYTVQPMGWNGVGIIDDTITSYFPYKFTNDQKDALTSVIQDLNGCVPMQRLIHGEVGSGKTAVAFYAAMLAALNGKRTLILCPTTILAQQHYQTMRDMGWDDVGLCLGTKKNPVSLYEGIKIIIGTHVLLNEDYLFRLGNIGIEPASLVIIDEFQKFGVEQRAKIQQNHPHLLLLSATPIPRTLAASVFGDLDVSTIRQLPIQRGTVVTRWVLPDRREGMYEIIERELAKGHQAYVVYPRISGDEDTVSAECGYEDLREAFGTKGYIVDIITGQQHADTKKWALQEFRNGDTQILVSTIIAEVGLDNPNATVMVVEGADRFGLSQLHQLRGRVCRSTDTVFCFLISETANPISIARLDVIEKINDGFVLAEHDLRLRGPGELFSTRQHGLPDLKFASVVDDYDLMIEAKELVQSGSIGDGVQKMMQIKYGDSLQLGGVT